MSRMKLNVLLLSGCQALMMTANSLLVTVSALVGFQLATDKTLATLPFAVQLFATMMLAIPASLLMKHIGRKRGFMTGVTIGLAGAVLAMVAITHRDFVLFTAGVGLVGAFNGFGIYYRFAAADVATEAWRSRAVSYVMAGGVIAALAGPNLARWTVDLVPATKFAGSFGGMMLLYVLSFALLSVVRIPPDQEEVSGLARPLGEIARQPRFLVALVVGAVGYGTMVLVMTATPLAMQFHHHSFADTTFVIQWHVLGMFAPSFVTGYLITRYGVMRIMLAGALMTLACVLTNLTGTEITYFWIALFLLGTGWNFMFIGATTLLTTTYKAAEKAKTQALNDFIVFSVVALSSLSSGALLHYLGWKAVNVAVIPLLLLATATTLWQCLAGRRERVPASADSSLPREVDI
jgi:predicted MFS family arabinose efflux permease